jgi:hypothetical protein
MPLEGHWRRQSTALYKLTRRERTAAIAAALATCVAIAVLVAVTIGDKAPAPRKGCIAASVPGVMGGSNALDACGDRARRLCALHERQADPFSRAIDEACRRAGID